MKKLLFLAFAAILTLGGASSCSKVRTCECADASKTYLLLSAKKKDQKKLCDDYAVAAGTSCTVK